MERSMSSLAELPELVGFFSYSREDDEAFRGSLSALRDAVGRELAAQLGRGKRTFRLWQDQEAIAPGKDWESEITKAVEQAVFFIPIVTPRAVASNYCQFEFNSFLARERALGRADLVFPILYISVPALQDEVRWRGDPVLSIVAKRQYVDWRPLRHLATDSTAFGEAIERFCTKVVETLREPWLSPEERRRQEEEADDTLKLWDLGSGDLIRTFAGHADTVFAVAITPDGRTGLSGSGDQTLKLWDLGSGASIRSFAGHDGLVLSVASAPDGRTALSGSADGTLKLWDLT